MNKRLAIVAGLFVAMVSPCLLAQQIEAMHVNIPFDFRIGDQLVPSGTYLIQSSATAIMLREVDGRMLGVSFLTIPESRLAAPAKSELVFNRYGNDYFLASVWSRDSKNGRALPKSKQEKRIADLARGSLQTAAVQAK
jgi:hypothetical protein